MAMPDLAPRTNPTDAKQPIDPDPDDDHPVFPVTAKKTKKKVDLDEIDHLTRHPTLC